MAYVAPEVKVVVLGVEFQAFKTEDSRVVFSQSGVARGFEIDETSVRRIRASKTLKALPDKDFSPGGRLKTTSNSQPISVVTEAELVAMVGILAERGNDRAVAMHQASFAVVLKAEVDKALGQPTDTKEDIAKAAKLREQAEQARVQAREDGKLARNDFTATLKEHGVYGYGYANNTNAIYTGLHDKTATQLKAERGTDNVRDAMTAIELIDVTFAERLAALNIERQNAQGNAATTQVSRYSAEQVRKLIDPNY